MPSKKAVPSSPVFVIAKADRTLEELEIEEYLHQLELAIENH